MSSEERKSVFARAWAVTLRRCVVMEDVYIGGFECDNEDSWTAWLAWHSIQSSQDRIANMCLESTGYISPAYFSKAHRTVQSLSRPHILVLYTDDRVLTCLGARPPASEYTGLEQTGFRRVGPDPSLGWSVASNDDIDRYL